MSEIDRNKKAKIVSGDIIFRRLSSATDDELKEICTALKIKDPTQNLSEISEEYRKSGGHTAINIFRNEQSLPYKTILIDVADKLCPGKGWTKYKLKDKSTEEEIEDRIEGYIFERVKKEWEKFTPLEKKQKEKELKKELENKGYAPSVTSSIVSVMAGGAAGAATALPLTLSVFYSGVFASLSASVFGASTSLLLLSGTGVGLIVAIPILVTTLGGPAYRKTIPATIQMIRIRRRLEGEGKL